MREEIKVSFNFYRNIMQEKPDQNRKCEKTYPCSGCRWYRPDWKYRFCEYLECPMIKGFMTFRDEIDDKRGDGDNAGFSDSKK